MNVDGANPLPERTAATVGNNRTRAVQSPACGIRVFTRGPLSVPAASRTFQDSA